jgi:hypothetical protein
MSSKYDPPHKRSQIQIPVSSRKTTLNTIDEKEFVPLSKIEEPKTASKVDWKSVNFENIRTVDLPPPPPMSVPIRRQPERAFDNNEDSDDSYVDRVEQTGPIDDGWTIVEKKVKVKRDKVQEALDNGDAPLSDEDEEESYWNDQPEEYETYWDRKP